MSNLNNRLANDGVRETQLVETIRNLERFCSEIVTNKLLWTPEVLNFF
jgi:hypothetical protein